MTAPMPGTNDTLRMLAEGNLSVLDTLLHMHDGSLEASGLDPQTFMLTRIAALATLDAAPASWLMNMRVSGMSGVTPDQVVGVLVAVAPVIGTARVVAAASNLVGALALADDLNQDTTPPVA